MRRFVLFAAMFGVMCAATSFGLNVSISGTNATRDQPLIDFITNNIDGAVVTYGNYSDPANIPAGTELFMIGRNLSSTAYANAANSATFNALTIPVVCFTSYIARPDGDRWGWHDAGLIGGWNVTGDETTVTIEGAGFLGVDPGAVNWFTIPTAADSFWGTGSGSVGEGHVLATLGGEDSILAAGWNEGELSGTGVAFGGNRLLFNLPQNPDNNSVVVVPDTAAGQEVLITLINALQGSNPFGRISNPYPPNRATDVELEVTLSWNGTPDPADENLLDPSVKKYYVYIDDDNTDTDPNLFYEGEVTVTDWSSRSASYGPLSLGYEQGISWQIEEGLDDGSGGVYAPGDPNNLMGPIWSFTTLPEEPSVNPVVPGFVAVDAGTAAVVLSAAGTNVTSYEWYKVGNPTALIDDDVNYSIETIGDVSELTILDVQSGDEGYYYCYVENTAGSAASESGRVMIHRLTSYWPLDTDNAVVVDGNDVQLDTVDGYNMILSSAVVPGSDTGLDYPALDTNVVDAVVGDESLWFNNSNQADPNNAWGQYALIEPGVAEYEDITISCWVNWGGGGNWQRIIDFGNGTGEYMFLSPNAAGTNLRFVISDGGEQLVETGLLATGEWTCIVVTLNGDTARMYVNGELVATNAAFTLNPVQVDMTVNYIADSQYVADPYFNGLIDDLKIYNYARTTEQIAQDYLAVKGEYICNNELEALAFDYNDDCLVNLEDFALFVAEWLDSNRIYPAP